MEFLTHEEFCAYHRIFRPGKDPGGFFEDSSDLEKLSLVETE